ncbi:MAG: cyclic pyranopterin monophosphate synthase MoaC [Cytophagales bacterium]|nr:cyclic pyranopterin monophosphate synthase MoaC [Cytophagales bacterium]
MKEAQDKRFTHLDKEGNPNMVDVSHKIVTRRTAKARALVQLTDEILDHMQKEDIHTKKGPVFQTAILAGIMAAKKTGELIPLCHPLPLENCHLTIRLHNQNNVEIIATASITAKTGVEMEALTAASVAALTIYDMCKAMSHRIVIKEIMLLEKSGGKKDFKP